MITIVPFRREHIAEVMVGVDNPDGNRGKQFLHTPDAMKIIEETAGTAYTALLDGKPVMSAGIVKIEDNSYSWALVAKMSQGNLIRLCKIAKRGIDDILAGLGVDRCKCGVLKEFKQGYQFAKLMGFTQERGLDRDKYIYMVKSCLGHHSQ